MPGAPPTGARDGGPPAATPQITSTPINADLQNILGRLDALEKGATSKKPDVNADLKKEIDNWKNKLVEAETSHGIVQIPPPVRG